MSYQPLETFGTGRVLQQAVSTKKAEFRLGVAERSQRYILSASKAGLAIRWSSSPSFPIIL
jgi:hypothetical protein